MAESTLTYTCLDLKKAIGYFLGWGNTVASWSAAQIVQVDNSFKEGMHRYYYPHSIDGNRPHKWTWLNIVATLATAAAATKATTNRARTSNVSTLTTAVHGFAVGQYVTISGMTDTTFNGSFYVKTVPSTTTFTFDNTGSDVGSGADTGGSVLRDASRYKLPDAFGSMMGPITYASADSSFNDPIEIVPESRIRYMHQVDGDRTGKPYFAAIRAIDATITTGSRQEIYFWPAADAAYTLSYPYKANPDNITSDANYPLGGLGCNAAAMAAVKSAADEIENDNIGLQYANYQAATKAAIEHDLDNMPTVIGYNGDPGVSRPWEDEIHPMGEAVVTFNGV